MPPDNGKNLNTTIAGPLLANLGIETSKIIREGIN